MFVMKKNILLVLLLVSLFGEIVNAQTTVTYTLGNTSYYTNFVDGSAGNFANSGTTELGMWAHGTGNQQVVSWRNFKTSGDNTGSNRSLQVGDVFVGTVAATATNGSIGLSLNANASTGSWANRISNSRLYFYESGGPSTWYFNSSAGNTSLNYSTSSTFTDYKFVVYITSYTTADVELYYNNIIQTRLYNQTLNGSGGVNIDGFSLFLQYDWNGSSNQNIYWKQPFTVTNNKNVNLGYYLSTGNFTPGLIADGLDAASTSTVSVNAVNIGGNSGTKVILNQTNSYTGTTNINANATLQLGNPQALGTSASGTSITSGGAIDMNGTNYSTSEALTINGTGVSSSGALYNSSVSTATYTGLLTLGSACTINGGTGTIALSNTGTITGSGFGLTLGGGQAVALQVL